MEKVANSENSRSFIEIDDEEDLRGQESEDVDDPSSQAEEGSSTSSPSWSRESAAQLACSATMMHRASHRPGWLVQKYSIHMLPIHLIYNASVYRNTHARVQNNAMKASVYVCVCVCVCVRADSGGAGACYTEVAVEEEDMVR